jgi:selenocysteine-specific elongation factor
MPLIGTAGHVDHGKSSLIQRLTGRDPDRWAEEKRRGLTIDLGFAWTTLPLGTEVSFVDVPGHERYLKNMLAGIEAIDVALFVVAADEGWMPQSEEHLAVLDLLGVDSGLVALTKTDLVDTDLLELAQIETSEKLEGTSLETAQIIPVSSVSGDGIDDLVEELERLLTEIAVRNVGRPRLWVDRSFSAKGSGTVATGTLLDGALAVDQKIRLYPGDRTARIRTIQSHETTLEKIQPGRRVALNLSGIDKDDVRRGEMIGLETQWAVTTRFLASLSTARYVDEFERRGAYQLHIGSGVHSMEITGLADGMTVIQTQDPVPAAWGDRFIIRDTGRKLVVAGGIVLDPSPGHTRCALTSGHRLANLATSDEVAEALLALRRTEKLDRLSAHTLGGTSHSGRLIGESVFSIDEIDRLTLQTGSLVRSEHDTFPLRVGLSLATLANTLGVEASVAEEIVDRNPTLERRGPDVAVASREVDLDPASEAAWQATQNALSAGLGVPLASELDLGAELLHLKIRNGELISVGNDLVFLPLQIEQLKATLGAMGEDFTVADFRDAIGLSRKYVVPILEWADKEGLTVRRGDTRRIR